MALFVNMSITCYMYIACPGIQVTACLHSVPPQDETIGPDPFYDLEQHALLGVANISLECLLHDIDFMYDAPIVAPTGKVCVCDWGGGGGGVLCGDVFLSSHSRYVAN